MKKDGEGNYKFKFQKKMLGPQSSTWKDFMDDLKSSIKEFYTVALDAPKFTWEAYALHFQAEFSALLNEVTKNPRAARIFEDAITKLPTEWKRLINPDCIATEIERQLSETCSRLATQTGGAPIISDLGIEAIVFRATLSCRRQDPLIVLKPKEPF